MSNRSNNVIGKEISFEEYKEIELDILKFVADFCEKNGLRYFLADGTLLGAIRHHGFIPWDDDIDIQMPRPDLFKLIELFNKQSGSKRYHLIPPQDPIAQHYFVKIIDTETVKIEPHLNYKNGFLGVDIDIFALDGCPEDEKDFLRWARNIRGYSLAYVYKKRCLFRSVLSRGKDYIKKRTIAKFVPFLPANEVINRIYSLVRQYPYETSKYIARIGIVDLFRTLSDRWEPTYAEFEGQLFRIPKGFDEILTKQYGDYMTFPPVEDQVIHHSNCAYWRKK